LQPSHLIGLVQRAILGELHDVWISQQQVNLVNITIVPASKAKTFGLNHLLV